MSPDPEPAGNEYDQLRETLELYPGIKLKSVEGNPPDNYEIEYHLKGYVRNPDGSVTTADLHRVRITLPFGYPHFPPTVKPLTHIFHPDIDPAAIRIADHWQKNPSLPDLVLTIGEMICGNIYSRKDPFNQEAADWYLQHAEELPLDVLQIADIADTSERFDTLDDDTFSSLGLDDEDIFGEEAEVDEGEVELVRLQVEQKNFFAASRTLSEIPSSVNIPDREELEQTIATALKSSDKLYKQVERLEDEGKLDEAAEVIGQLEQVAADTPGLAELRNRVLQSQSLAGSFSVDDMGDEGASTQEEGEGPPPPPPTEEKKSRKKKSRGSSLPVAGIVVGGVLLLVLLAGGFLYMKDKKVIAKSRAEFEAIQSLVKTRQYIDAQSDAEEILRNLKGVVLLKSAGNNLAGEVRDLVQSEDFQQGLLGNVLFDGKYVSFARARMLGQLKTLEGEAEALVKQGRIRKALAAYQDAVAFARKNDLIERARELEQTINNLRFEEALATAKRAEDEKEWENAANTYRRALELSRNLSDPEEAAEITRRLTTATFRHEIDRSRKSFTGAQWQETIGMLQHAKELIEQNPSAVSPRERAELNRLLLESRLYQKLTVAREAYEAHRLEESITQYEDALRFLDTERNSFGPGIDESYAKIAKTLLMMRITKEQREAVKAREDNRLQEVLDHYDNTLRLISESPYREDDTLRKVAATVRAQKAEVGKELAMKRNIDYLTENFEDIFRRNYPTFAGSKFSNPKVTFNRKIGHRLLFNMTCIERSMGSSSRLALQYIYDPSSDSWSLYTGQ